MAWQPGRYYAFSPDVIRASVPTSSGVYDLFNFNDQLYVGESDNLQDALLRHCRESASQAPSYRPTGFTFQLCAADVRERQAAELIEKLRPIRQVEMVPTEGTPPGADPGESDLSLDELDPTRIDLEEFSMHEREHPPEARPRYYFERAQGTALIALFAMCMTASFYLGMLTGKNSQQLANRESEEHLASIPVMVAPKEPIAVDPSEKPGTGIEMAGDFLDEIPGKTAAGMEMTVAQTTVEETKRLLAPEGPAGVPAVPQAGSTGAKSSTVVPAAGNLATSKKWAVQIASAPAQEIADALADRLKSAGYESYVIQAQVKGQTFYRVRVGSLNGQEQAESLRQALADQEGFRDAFLTMD